jgi:hypothetical protein
MPIFYLEPKDGNVSDPSWEASYLKEGCWVEARTEELARHKVEGATLRMLDVKPGRPVVFPPWTQPRLTDCKPDEPPRDIPAGKVLTESGQLLDA